LFIRWFDSLPVGRNEEEITECLNKSERGPLHGWSGRKGVHMAGSKLGRAGFMVVLVLALAVGLAIPANAAVPGFITCVATPKVHVEASTTTPGQYDWTVTGTGACVARAGTLTVALDGAGTSTGLGLCTGLVVQDLDITMKTTLTRVFSGEVFNKTHHWVASLTTFPIVTPFAVNNEAQDSTVGVGAIFTHIFLKCPPAPISSDSSAVTWVQQF
jgi:hypothetical protein